MDKKNLEQTKAKFKLIGKVEGIDRDNAYTEEVADKGKNEGKVKRKLGFQVKTSETNKIRVSMFSYEPENVFLWNSDKKKKALEENKEYKGDWVEFSKWQSKQDEYREKGYAVLQSRVGLTYGEDGKIISKGLPTFVAIEEIYNNLNNGDSVVIEGSISYSTYKTQDDKEKEGKNYNIERIFKIKDIDFEDEKFEEVTYFEQEMVFVDAYAEKKENKVFVTGRHINYNKTFHDTQFVIDYSDGNGGVDENMVKLSTAFVKKMKFGDLLNVYGDILNRAITEVAEDADDGQTEEEKLLASLGGRHKPKHAQTRTNTTYISEAQIFGVDHWDKKHYSEDDFEIDDLLEDDSKNELQNELGGKGKKKGANPFDDEDGDLVITEDDLPF